MIADVLAETEAAILWSATVHADPMMFTVSAAFLDICLYKSNPVAHNLV